MARPLMSPQAMQRRRDLALKLLDRGASSIRAVATAVGAHPSSVHAWKKAAGASGVAPLVVFDRRRNEGVEWYESDALAKQAKRAERRHSAIGDTRIVERKRSEPAGDVRRQRNRGRRLGERLRVYLGLPEAVGAAVSAAGDIQAARYGWDMPELRVKIAAILERHPESVALGGLSTALLRRTLGPSFMDDEDDPPFAVARFAANFSEAMRRFGFDCAADGRWSVPRSL